MRIKVTKRILIGFGMLILLAELIYNRLIQPLPAAISILMSVIAAVIMIIGIVFDGKDVNK